MGKNDLLAASQKLSALYSVCTWCNAQSCWLSETPGMERAKPYILWDLRLRWKIGCWKVLEGQKLWFNSTVKVTYVTYYYLYHIPTLNVHCSCMWNKFVSCWITQVCPVKVDVCFLLSSILYTRFTFHNYQCHIMHICY